MKHSNRNMFNYLMNIICYFIFRLKTLVCNFRAPVFQFGSITDTIWMTLGRSSPSRGVHLESVTTANAEERDPQIS